MSSPASNTTQPKSAAPAASDGPTPPVGAEAAPSITDASRGDGAALGPAMLAAIKLACQEAVREVLPGLLKAHNEEILSKISSLVKDLKALEQKYNDIENSIADCSARVENVLTEFIPAINKKMCDVNTAMAIKLLDMDQHRRKWSLIIQGVEGEAGEAGHITRQKCVALAHEYLNVPDASTKDFAACHRLKHEGNAAIILKFLDLDQRNRWLYGAKGLKECPTNISISPDLPPAARGFKKELLQKRKNLDADTKKISRLQYLKTFPYVHLAIRDQTPILPSVKRQNLAENFLGMSFRVPFNLN